MRVSKDLFKSALLSTLEGTDPVITRADPEKLYAKIDRFDLTNDGAIRGFRGSECIGVLGNYSKWRNDYGDSLSIRFDPPMLVEVKSA